MKKNFLPHEELYEILNGEDDLNIPIGFLPHGEFRYPVTLINPYEKKAVLSFSVKVKNEVKYKSEVYFENVVFNKAFHFSVAEGEVWQNAEIGFQCPKGSLLKIYYPASPVLFQKIRHLPANVQGIEEKIGFEISNFKPGDNKSQPVVAQDAGQLSDQALDQTQIESFIHTRYFRGVMSMQDAEKQLDYIIYHKLFAPDETTRGFRKWKRSVYRKMLILFYRIMVRNSNRKRYLTKIYRNYINNSVIADNFIDT